MDTVREDLSEHFLKKKRAVAKWGDEKVGYQKGEQMFKDILGGA